MDGKGPVVYNTERGNIVRWENSEDQEYHCEENDYVLTNFLSNLYRIYQKKKDDRNDEDSLILKNIGKFIEVVRVTHEQGMRIVTP